MHNLKNSINKYENILSILLIALVVAVSYLVHASQFGIYRDSWFLLAGGHIDGPAKFFEIWSIDRPGVAYLFAAAYSLFGDNLLAYNLLVITLRFLGALGLLWALRMIWPEARLQTLLVVLLFVIYPGFIQLPNAMEYLPHFTSLALFIFSVAFMIKAIQSRNLIAKIILVFASLVFSLLYLFLMEYYIGMEGLRLALLWLLVIRVNPGKSFPRKVAEFVRRYLPFAILAAGFLYWRVFLFSNTRSATDINSMAGRFMDSPLLAAMNWATTLAKDYVETLFFAWAVPPYTIITAARLRDFLAAGAAGFAMALATLLLLWAVSKREKQPTPEHGELKAGWGREFFLIGSFALLIALVPASISPLNVSFGRANFDRFTIPGIIGASLVLVFLIYTIRNTRVRGGVIAFCVVIGVMTHYINGINFANKWKHTRETLWQLTWRAPSIKPGTLLLSEFFDLSDLGGNPLWPANLIYYPQPGPFSLASEILLPETARYLLDGRSIPRDFRSFLINKNYHQMLLLTRPDQGSCLHAIDGLYPDFTDADGFATLSIARFSELDRIDPDAPPAQPPVDLLGQEPTRGWCYYYEKASLARQKGDWQEVIRLGREAESLGLRPDDYSEWIPFIQAYAYNGDFQAVDSLIPIIQENLRARVSLCEGLQQQVEEGLLDQGEGVISGREYLLKNLCGE